MRQYEAREALTGVGAAQARLAEHVGRMSFWRHAATGALIALTIGPMSISPLYGIAGGILTIVGFRLVVRWDKRKYGVFINGFRKGRTRALTFPLVAVNATLLLAALAMSVSGSSLGSRLALTAIAFVLGTAASVIWQRIYLRELTQAER